MPVTTRTTFDRRQVSAGLTAVAALPFTSYVPGSRALAETAVAATGTWRRLAELAQQARALGLSVPRMSLAPSAAIESYAETLPAVIDFMDSVAASAKEARDVSSAEVDNLLEQASEALRAARNAERAPRETAGEERRAAPLAVPAFEQIADEYRELFKTAVIDETKRANVNWYVSKILDPERRKGYEAVFEETCVPWYFVAITHGMEAGFDLKSHLHNGDPLKRQTVQVPAGRPKPWLPPSDWVSSAVDAMRYDKLDEKADWDLAKMLYRWEGYNGWRSRVLKGIHTPYLWSFSNHYTKGKYVADNVWDPNAVSNQCGAAVMLKALVEAGAIAPPA
jgi:lysozyme family protein